MVDEETRGCVSRRLHFSPEFRIEGEWRNALCTIGLQQFFSLACTLWLVDYMAHDSRNPALLAREDDSCLVGERASNHVPSLGSATTPELGMVSTEPGA
jgi:hypothetical protein